LLEKRAERKQQSVIFLLFTLVVSTAPLAVHLFDRLSDGEKLLQLLRCISKASFRPFRRTPAGGLILLRTARLWRHVLIIK